MFEHRLVVNARGRELYLAFLYQHWTYAHWYEGAGTPIRRRTWLEHARTSARGIQKALDQCVFNPHLLVLEATARALEPIEPIEPDDALAPTRGPALPPVLCIAQLESTKPKPGGDGFYSGMVLVWCQETLAMPIADEALQAMIDLDWDALAEDFSP